MLYVQTMVCADTSSWYNVWGRTLYQLDVSAHTIVCIYSIYKEAPEDGPLRSETCRADTWALINNQCCYTVYPVGMYIYCRKWYTDLPMSNRYLSTKQHGVTSYNTVILSPFQNIRGDKLFCVSRAKSSPWYWFYPTKSTLWTSWYHKWNPSIFPTCWLPEERSKSPLPCLDSSSLHRCH